MTPQPLAIDGAPAGGGKKCAGHVFELHGLPARAELCVYIAAFIGDKTIQQVVNAGNLRLFGANHRNPSHPLVAPLVRKKLRLPASLGLGSSKLSANDHVSVIREVPKITQMLLWMQTKCSKLSNKSGA